MPATVYITGSGPVGPLGQGIDAVWNALAAGEVGLGPVGAFDASGTGHDLAGEVDGLDVKRAVPKSYRKAVKVMARDIELAVVAAKLAAEDAQLVTPGTADGATPGVADDRFGCHIGAGLIAADENELGAALAESTDADGAFSLKKWGESGMQQLTPLWLLKYLPNMLACHVTIIHEARGPSNTITCGEASGGLSIGESLRVIQRGAADACFCGGAESRLNPMAFHRQVLGGRLAPTGGSVRPFDEAAEGTAVAEGGGILVIETAREPGASRRTRAAGAARRLRLLADVPPREPEPAARPGRSLDRGGDAACARRRRQDAGRRGRGDPLRHRPPAVGRGRGERAAGRLRRPAVEHPRARPEGVDREPRSGAGGFEVAVAAEALSRGQLPPILHRDQPRPDFEASSEDVEQLDTILVASTAVGGQNTALVLEKA